MKRLRFRILDVVMAGFNFAVFVIQLYAWVHDRQAAHLYIAPINLISACVITMLARSRWEREDRIDSMTRNMQQATGATARAAQLMVGEAEEDTRRVRRMQEILGTRLERFPW